MTREDASALIEMITRDPAVPPLDPHAIARLLVVLVSQPNAPDLDSLRRLMRAPTLD